jgi:hypothetical protein
VLLFLFTQIYADKYIQPKYFTTYFYIFLFIHYNVLFINKLCELYSIPSKVFILVFYMKRKGFYIKQGVKDKSIYLNIFKPDFQEYLTQCKDQEGWIKLRIFERETVDEKGHTHNMEQVNIPENQ